MYRFLLVLVSMVLGIFSILMLDIIPSLQLPRASIHHVVVLPHHNLTGKRIDQFYQDLQEKFSHFDRIVIISPDHFGGLRQSIETSPSGIGVICYLGTCVKNLAFPSHFPPSDASGIFSHSGFTNEHGIGEHIRRIAHFFPDTPVTPLILRRKLSVGNEEEKLAEQIAQLPEERILVIASVDFSHHVREDVAEFHDQKSIDVLNMGSGADFDDIEVDCRNCLATAKSIATLWKYQFFHLLERTSVEMLFGSGAGIENTSHIFGEFTSSGNDEPEGIFLFAGDTHWARGFPYLESKMQNYRSQSLRIFYQKYDPHNDLITKYHRILSGFDDVIVNWESGLAESGNCLKSGKMTQMVTDSSVIPYFHSLGVTLANVANNHSHDCGKKEFESSISGFLSGSIIPFGYEHIAFRNIRGIHFAFLGINLIEEKENLDQVYTTIRTLTASGNVVIVNIHFGTEYVAGHTEKQTKITHALVDAGARLVAGHHSHVVGDNEVYKDVPIYYSLGNFVFDQPFPETLRGILLLCSVNSRHTKCRTVDIFHNPGTYMLSFSHS